MDIGIFDYNEQGGRKKEVFFQEPKLLLAGI